MSLLSEEAGQFYRVVSGHCTDVLSLEILTRFKPLLMVGLGLFSTGRSSRRDNLGCPSVCTCTLLNKALRMALKKEFLLHSKESRGVLGQAKHSSKLVSKH